MKKKIIGILLSIVLIGVTGYFAGMSLINYKNTETGELIDYAAVYGLSEGQYSVIVNHAMADYKAVKIDGQLYLDLENIIADLDHRFYWDLNESILIYTTPEGNVKAFAGQRSYYSPEGEQSVDYEPVKVNDHSVYVAIDYLKMFTRCSLSVFEDPGRLVVRTEWEDDSVVDVTKETYIRYRSDSKSETFRKAEIGERLYALDTGYEEWTFVATEDGYTGWVLNKNISGVYTRTAGEPDYSGFEYTTTQRDHAIKMAWHQVMSAYAADLAVGTLDTCPGVNVVSPTFFAFNDTDGNVRSIASHTYVDYAHSKGMEVWALFSNQFRDGNGDLGDFDGVATNDVLAYTSKRELAISQIISYCQEYGIDGINLDFERIMAPSESETASKNYIQFVRELGIACHKNNIIFSIDNYVPMASAHYNRQEQNVFADYLVIMGYDEHYAGGAEAGSVASIGFVEQGITDTLNENISASKVINGIPFYARIWYTDAANALYYYGDVPMTDAARIAAEHGVTPLWDEEDGDSYISYQAQGGETYQIWTESVQSVDRKMQLIANYQLGGVACWKLGQEDSGVWSVINQYLP